jgi:nicotinamide-nucleotide amidase
MVDYELSERALYELAERVGASLKAHGLMLATAESCTGGWVGQAVTAVAGSSHWYERGFITYSNEAKSELLEVSPHTLSSHGAVSEETVREMVAGALKHSHAQVALAISGIAGPGGGTPGKPVGTVCFAWCLAGEKPASETVHFDGDRTRIRLQAVTHALRGVLERIEHLSQQGARLDKRKALQLLRLARVAHLKWRAHAEELIGGQPVSESKAPVVHTDCEFGHWYYGEGKELLGYLDRYLLVDEAHRIMHGIYRDIFVSVKEGDLETAKARLPELVATSQSLLEAIELLEQEVAGLAE